MSKKKPKVRERRIVLDPNPKGKSKALGGAKHDDWNDWLASTTAGALPVNQNDDAVATQATVAAFSGMIDMKPADAIEGILISQLVAASQASLSMYRRAWAQPSEYFEARTKYLSLADKAARTVAILTERLDHHRGRGQQQITVKHVTVNADQAVVTDQVVAGKSEGIPPGQLAALTERPMQLIPQKTITQTVGRGKDKK
jgi:hypothetical protein